MLTWSKILVLARLGNETPVKRLEKSVTEWKSILDDETFRVTRLKGTELAHSSEMCTLFAKGKYACSCCDILLFDADTKFDSGTGWPSFNEPIASNVVSYRVDESYRMKRIEVTCSTCDAHLGHVFPDGPTENGLRYCINAVALNKQTE